MLNESLPKRLSLGFGVVVLWVFCFAPGDHPPGEDDQKRAEERGNEVLEGNLQLAEAKVDSEEPEELAADHRSGHPDHQVRPEAQALFFQSDNAPRESAREPADNDPDNDLADVHDSDATLCDPKTYRVLPENIARFRVGSIFNCPEFSRTILSGSRTPPRRLANMPIRRHPTRRRASLMVQ
jgi:hypothetical protein